MNEMSRHHIGAQNRHPVPLGHTEDLRKNPFAPGKNHAGDLLREHFFKPLDTQVFGNDER
jgi:hypothetical protein